MTSTSVPSSAPQAPADEEQPRRARTGVGRSEPTVAQSTTQAIRFMERETVRRELRAARATAERLRAEMSGLMHQLQRLDHDPEATSVVLPQVQRPTQDPDATSVVLPKVQRPAQDPDATSVVLPQVQRPAHDPDATSVVLPKVQRPTQDPDATSVVLPKVQGPTQDPDATSVVLPQVQRPAQDPDATSVIVAKAPAAKAAPQTAPQTAPRTAPPAPRPGPAPARPSAPVHRPATVGGNHPAPPQPVVPGRALPQPAPARPAAQQAPVAKPAPVMTATPTATPAATPAAASSGLAAGYAEVLAGVLGVADVPVTSNFFDDLGADSMVMARFCAKVRSRQDLPNIAIKDIYKAPTIAELAAAGDAKVVAVVGASAAQGAPASVSGPGRPAPVPCDLDPATVRIAIATLNPVAQPVERPAPVGTLSYLLCGLLQLLFLLGYPALVSFAFAIGAEWVLTADTPLNIYLRSAGVAGGLFLGTALLPIVAKWLLIGRWKATQFPVYGLRYYRFWLVKTLIRTNPLVRFVGTPLYPFYLRLLGAKIGKGVTILSPTMPVATDLLTIGADTIIRKASSFTCYRAIDGQIVTGPVTIGAAALVGEATVLDIGTSIGDRAQLGHTSSLHAGQSVPAGQRWHGSPAEPTSVDYRAVPFTPGTGLRRFGYSFAQLVTLFGIVGPLGLSGLALLVREVPQVQQLLTDVETAAAHVPFHLDVVIIASTLFFGALVLGIMVMTTVPRLLALLVRPNRVHRLYGLSYWALRSVTRLTNVKFALKIVGDSSFVVGYLRAIGYKFFRVEQTGSNFGEAVAHDNPFLCEIGSGTVVADGLTMLNTDYSSTSFVVAPVRIGAHSFLGNAIFYPARSRVGADCLLATKVMVPVDGPVRHGVGLLGSPSFEIPRSVERDARLALGPEERRRGVRAKARHNLTSIALLLLSRWVYLVLFVLLARTALDLYPRFGAPTIAVLGAAEVLLTFVYFILLDAAVRRLSALRPQGVSIYDRAFWRHERFWKVTDTNYFQLLNGTPLKSVMWRALGVRVGRRLFDDGCMLTERSFVTIGDNCMLNERTVVQCHSQENDAFKSDLVTIGSGVTLGVGAFVHYGTELGDGSVLEADSFLMKGEEIPPHTTWGGNPATELAPTRSYAGH